MISIDQWISVGGLAAAALPLIFIAGRHFAARYLGVRISVALNCENGAYIEKVDLNANGDSSVSSASVWAKLELLNSTKERISIVGIKAGYHGTAMANARLPIFKRVDWKYEAEFPGPALELPITIEPGETLWAWCLLSVPIEKAIGTLLLKKYCAKASEMEEVKRAQRLFEVFPTQIADDVKRKMPFIAVQETGINSITVTDPLLHRDQDKFILAPGFGKIPRFAAGDLMPEIWNILDAFPPLRRGKPVKYKCVVSLADSREVTYDISPNKAPLWFLSRKSQ